MISPYSIDTYTMMFATVLYFLGMVTTVLKLGEPKITFDTDYYYFPPLPPPPPPIYIWKGNRNEKWWNPPPQTEDYDGDSS